jgi:hypothetical protein
MFLAIFSISTLSTDSGDFFSRPNLTKALFKFYRDFLIFEKGDIFLLPCQCRIFLSHMRLQTSH